MKKIAFLVLIFCVLQSQAQSKFNIGPVYSMGASNILKTSSMDGMNMGSEIDNKMSMKLNAGAGLKAEYFFSEKWGIFLQTGFQQRGAIFKEYIDDYKPRYRLNYWDVMAGGAFRTKGLMKNHQLTINLGVTQHTLLEANRVYDTGSGHITGEFKRIDIGLFLGIGGNIPISEKDIFQIQLFTNAGLLQTFSGNLAMNGMSGRNFLTGIQIAYLIGKSKKKE
jgi:Outer membrane protein beta-barrel domain